MGGGREKGEPGQSSNLNPVFKCLHMSAFGRNRTGVQLHKGLPLEETLLSAANFLLPFYSIFFFLTISESDFMENREEMEKGKSDSLFLTQHMCVCVKIACRANWGPFLVMKAG